MKKSLATVVKAVACMQDNFLMRRPLLLMMSVEIV